MNLEFSEEQLFIRDQARNFLSQECTASVVRAVLDTELSFDKVLWQKIVDLGWTAMTIRRFAMSGTSAARSRSA